MVDTLKVGDIITTWHAVKARTYGKVRRAGCIWAGVTVTILQRKPVGLVVSVAEENHARYLVDENELFQVMNKGER